MRSWNRTLGCVLMAVGALIILGMILPGAFWWFVLGAVLIAVGCALMLQPPHGRPWR